MAYAVILGLSRQVTPRRPFAAVTSDGGLFAASGMAAMTMNTEVSERLTATMPTRVGHIPSCCQNCRVLPIPAAEVCRQRHASRYRNLYIARGIFFHARLDGDACEIDEGSTRFGATPMRRPTRGLLAAPQAGSVRVCESSSSPAARGAARLFATRVPAGLGWHELPVFVCQRRRIRYYLSRAMS